MDITPLRLDDPDDVRAWRLLDNAVSAVDAPWAFPATDLSVAGWFGHGWDGEPATPYVARADGEVVGGGSVGTSERDNLHLAWFEIQVHPDHRRRGHGSAILAHLEERARELGRTSAGMAGWESDMTRGFADRHGYDLKHQAINRRQYLAEVDRAELARRHEAALPHAADYEIERWPVPAPRDRLDDLATMTAAINDAPTGDLEIDDEVFDADRIEAYETSCLGRGERLYRLVARRRDSGELAGQTVVAVEVERPTIGHQHDTSVVRAHRGHRLGLVLKAEMLRWLDEEEPQLEEIDTWNAEENSQMIGVNELLGYRVMGRELAFQRGI